MSQFCLFVSDISQPSLFSVFSFTGLMFVPRDANLRELVVAERAVASRCKKNFQTIQTIKSYCSNHIFCLFVSLLMNKFWHCLHRRYRALPIQPKFLNVWKKQQMVRNFPEKFLEILETVEFPTCKPLN